jgi:hypothetical protein
MPPKEQQSVRPSHLSSCLPHLTLEGSFRFNKPKNIRWCEIKIIEWVVYLKSTGFGQIYLHYQCGMGRDMVLQQESTALCSKLWPHAGNAFQQFSDNLNAERTIDYLPFRHKFFMNHALFVKKYDQHDYDIGLLQSKHLGVW